MKIAILCEYLSYIGGGERVYCSWANMFSDLLGHDVTIVAMEEWGKPFYSLSPNIKIHTLNLRRPKFYKNPIKRKLEMIFKYWRDKKVIESYLNDNKFDIVIGIALNINLILANINGDFVKIGTEHSEYFAPNKYIRIIRNKLYSNFDLLTVLNKTDLQLFKKHNANTVVLLNPVETLQHQTETSALSNKIIISVGSLSPQKNQKDLISVMEKIHKEFPEWKLNIYGEGPLKEYLLSEINTKQLNDCITLKGVTNNVPAAIKEGSIFVLSSIIEGFGIVLIEAMSVGVPCVSYATAGPEMIIHHNKNGVLVNKNDIEGLYQAIKELIIDKEKRLQLGLKAKESVQQYNPSQVAKAWEKIFSSLIK